MKRFEYNGQTITVPLKEKYSIVVNILNNTDGYNATLLLLDNDTDFQVLLYKNVRTSCTNKDKVLNHVADVIIRLYQNGYFEKDIQNYEDYLRLMDLGIETDEQMRKVGK